MDTKTYSHKHNVEQKNLDTEEYILYDLICMKFKKAKVAEGERSQNSSYLWAVGIDWEEHEGALRRERNVLYLDVVGGNIGKIPLRYKDKFGSFYYRYVMGQLKNKHTSHCKFFISPLQKLFCRLFGLGKVPWWPVILSSPGISGGGSRVGNEVVELICALIKSSAAKKINFGASGLGGREGPSRSNSPN